MVPYPWGRGLFVWGKAIWVPDSAAASDLEAKRLELEEALNQLTAYADEAVLR